MLPLWRTVTESSLAIRVIWIGARQRNLKFGALPASTTIPQGQTLIKEFPVLSIPLSLFQSFRAASTKRWRVAVRFAPKTARRALKALEILHLAVFVKEGGNEMKPPSAYSSNEEVQV
jgi:hypothetical protein